MLKLRHEYRDLMILGDFEMHDLYEQKTWTFVKKPKSTGEESASKQELLVVCSFSDDEEPVDMPSRLKGRDSELLISTLGEEGAGKYLRPWEGRIYLIK